MRVWEKEAAAAAQAFGFTIIVGVRDKGTWFAAASYGGSSLKCEYDGAGPSDAVKAVIDHLAADAETAAARAEGERRQRQAQLDEWKRIRGELRPERGVV